MRRELLRVLKRVSAGVVVATIIMSSMGINLKVVNAATSDADKVKFVDVTYENFKTKIVSKEAPVYEGNDFEYGYLFGGWYAEQNEDNPIEKLADVQEGTTVYAKYVPAYVMGVKCQNHSQAAKNTKTNIRVVSSIDSRLYSAVGMQVEKITLKDGNFTKRVLVSDGEVKAYDGKFPIYNEEGNQVAAYTPKQVFGAESEYFTAASLTNISNYDMLICVQPYWLTLDGTRVDGLSRYVRVNDGVDGYVSVPINLKSATDVAAGLATIDYSSLAAKGYTLYAVEGGTVFGEMESKIDATNHKVMCVGNVSDISADAKSNDIFVSLRFKAPNGSSRIYAEDTFYNLTVDSVDFTDIKESDLNGYSVWDVQY